MTTDVGQPSTRPPRRPPGWALASSVLALVALVAGWAIAQSVQPVGSYDPVRQTISVLAGAGSAHRWIMTLGLYLVGAAHLVTAAGLRGLRTIARIDLAVGGAAGLGLAAFAEPAHGSNPAHVAFTTVGIAVLALFPCLVATRRSAAFPLRPRHCVVAGVLSALLIAWVLQAIAVGPYHGGTLGLAERVITAQQGGWPLLVVLALRRRPSGGADEPAAAAGRLQS